MGRVTDRRPCRVAADPQFQPEHRRHHRDLVDRQRLDLATLAPRDSRMRHTDATADLAQAEPRAHARDAKLFADPPPLRAPKPLAALSSRLP